MCLATAWLKLQGCRILFVIMILWMQKATTAAPVIWIRQSKNCSLSISTVPIWQQHQKSRSKYSRLGLHSLDMKIIGTCVRRQLSCSSAKVYLLFAASPTDDEEYLYIRRTISWLLVLKSRRQLRANYWAEADRREAQTSTKGGPRRMRVM